ncbi:hypothetical protein [Microbacterium sp.]|uniref:hypothetical protein n=1 Tax=Microbacterium sp. TaxID=51671 RepID=UPI0037C63D28
MTNESPRGLMLVFASPSDDSREQEFNAWYDDVHIPEILAAVQGVTAARRYRISPAQPAVPGAPAAPYLTVYDLDRPSAEVLASFAAARAELTMSDALGSGERAPTVMIYDASDAAPGA